LLIERDQPNEIKMRGKKSAVLHEEEERIKKKEREGKV
jgi:hypothetical protein